MLVDIYVTDIYVTNLQRTHHKFMEKRGVTYVRWSYDWYVIITLAQYPAHAQNVLILEFSRQLIYPLRQESFTQIGKYLYMPYDYFASVLLCVRASKNDNWSERMCVWRNKMTKAHDLPNIYVTFCNVNIANLSA